ncbi:hypothetical protein BLSTO_01686 [Blastocystis sp. subtype 1]
MEFPMKSYHMVQYYKHADSNPRVFIAPSKYIQGPGVVKYLGDYICSISPLKKDRSCLLLCSEGGIRRFGAKIEASLKEHNIKYSFVPIGHQCSWDEIDRVCKIAKEMDHCDFIVAIGGGKAVDLGKGVATTLDLPSIIMPTLASNDAPTSSLSVIYDEHSDERQGAYFNYKNPDMVVVDTEIIANAPARYLVAGMGDALATFVEARCSLENPLGESSVRVRPSLTALAIGEVCTKTILREGPQAIEISISHHML